MLCTLNMPYISEYQVKDCEVYTGSYGNQLAKVPRQIGVGQDIYSCVTCMARDGREVHALLVDHATSVTSVVNPDANKLIDIDVGLSMNYTLLL